MEPNIFPFNIENGHRGDALTASAPEIGLNFQGFAALAPFPTPPTPENPVAFNGTLLFWAPGALIGAEHFHFHLIIGYRGGALSASAPEIGVNFQQF